MSRSCLILRGWAVSLSVSSSAAICAQLFPFVCLLMWMLMLLLLTAVSKAFMVDQYMGRQLWVLVVFIEWAADAEMRSEPEISAVSSRVMEATWYSIIRTSSSCHEVDGATCGLFVAVSAVRLAGVCTQIEELQPGSRMKRSVTDVLLFCFWGDKSSWKLLILFTRRREEEGGRNTPSSARSDVLHFLLRKRGQTLLWRIVLRP